jgi:hypothetical protein
MTWVGITNTFLVAAANLLTAIATLVYVLRTKKQTAETKAQVETLQNIVDTGSVPIVKPKSIGSLAGGKHVLRQ